MTLYLGPLDGLTGPSQDDGAPPRRWDGGRDMAVQPWACVQALAAHHLRGMKRDQQRAVLLRADGREIEEIASTEGIAFGTAKARVGTATAEIYMCLPEGGKLR